jgi:hypothetical protein
VFDGTPVATTISPSSAPTCSEIPPLGSHLLLAVSFPFTPVPFPSGPAHFTACLGLHGKPEETNPFPICTSIVVVSEAEPKLFSVGTRVTLLYTGIINIHLLFALIFAQ